ncbi:MAG: hypothetical protein ACREAU_01100 [Nitrosopumilaceae archaeon]
MKLKDLLQEGPVFVPPTPSEIIEDKNGSFISTKTARQKYTKIGVFPLAAPIGLHKSIDILLSKTGGSVIGIVPANRPIDNEMGYKDVFFLMFKETLPDYLPRELQHDAAKQVEGVETHKELRGRGLATFAYFTLVAKGYTIISDFYHEFGGLKLWRRLAKLAGANNYNVNILLPNGDFVKDRNSNILEFNDGNYPKSKIWSTSPNQKHKDVLLVMRITP